jgi:DNA-3-methyladenine glycosylase II
MSGATAPAGSGARRFSGGAQQRAALARRDPVMAALIERLGPIDLAERLARRQEERPADAYGALLRSIIGQQVSTKAARTVHGRVLDLFGGKTPSPEQLLALGVEDLRGVGLSGRKVTYIRDLAQHIVDGELELDRIAELPDEQAIEEISAVRGLGRWTAEVFLMFHLERPDVLSGGDLGLRKAIQVEYGLEAMPTPEEVVAIGAKWSPYRSLASLYLWESLAAVP